MKKTTLTLTVLLAVSLFCYSQMRITYQLDSPSFILGIQNTDKYEVLDSSYLTVTYKLNYRSSHNDDQLSYNDMLNLEMGTNYNAFYSRNIRKIDNYNTEELKKGYMLIPPQEDYIGFDILSNHKDKTSTVTNRIPYTTQVIEYSESTPEIEWKYIDAPTDSIMGYECKLAEGTYGGRNWKVWYADEIPVPYGPWKLNGTKGLILKAADTENNFVFEAEGLTQTPQAIVRYDWDRKKMSKKEWQKFEKDMYANAAAFVRNTGARIKIRDNSAKGSHFLTEDWTAFYNPLEK